MANNLRYLFSVFIYCAIGLATHLWLVGSVMWHSAEVYVYMALWPFILIFKFLFWAGVVTLAVVAVVITVLGIVAIVEKIRGL